MLLLDTHAFLWFINGDKRLPKAMLNEIQTAEKVNISIVSLLGNDHQKQSGKADAALPCLPADG